MFKINALVISSSMKFKEEFESFFARVSLSQGFSSFIESLVSLHLQARSGNLVLSTVLARVISLEISSVILRALSVSDDKLNLD